jgi:flagellar biosynthesis protein FlhF
MSLKKFVGSTGRQAMLDARKVLGEGAVIISTRKTALGVEVVAAAQDELSEIAEMPSPIFRSARTNTEDAAKTEASSENRPRRETDHVPFLKFIQERPELTPTGHAVSPVHEKIPPTFEQTLPSRSLAVTPTTGISNSGDMIHEFRQELATLRSWIAGQFDAMSYQDALKRRPMAAMIQKDLLLAGFSPKLARDLSCQFPDTMDERQARTWAAAVLEKNLLSISAQQDPIEVGGIYALVGSTGVGKTTTIAKLASRCAVKYGSDSVGLITIDCYRIGAQDQLRIYGKILGISVHTAQDRDSLLSVLRSLAGKRLVLIDTVGLGQRDERVTELLATVGSSAIKRLLVLNCAGQAETLEDVLAHYRGSAPNHSLTGVILSKTDEAVRLGAALDVAIRHRLTVFYETMGQRVPEDIALANAKSLMLRAVAHQPARAFQVPDEEIGITFLQNRTKSMGNSLHV